MWSACGTVLTEAEVLDLVTELKPDLRRLPFEEFVNMMCRPLCDRPTLERRIRDTFPTFARGGAAVTPDALEAAMEELGRPVSSLVAQEMVAEAGENGKVTQAQFCAVNSVAPP